MLFTIIIFIIVLGILVFVHEFGHFIVAKKSGMVVEEFGFGFPPRLIGIKKIQGKWKVIFGHPKNPEVNQVPLPGEENNTIYSINTIPLGGFVRILGESNEQEGHPGSFINKGFWPRFFTLVAGVLMNVLLAFVIFTAGFMIGLPAAVDSIDNIPAHSTFSDPQIGILNVEKGKPADQGGIKPNDILLALDGNRYTQVSEVQTYIRSHLGQEINVQVKRGSETVNLKVTPNPTPKENEGPTGIELALIGKLKYSPLYAVVEGAKNTVVQLTGIFTGLYKLVTAQLGFQNLGGPVQIAKLTGQVADMGLIYLMQFTAFLSLNLAALNILPFPALDGGRVLFLIIEKIRGKKNNQKVEQFVNAAGFIFLLLLMVVVTINDVIRK